MHTVAGVKARTGGLLGHLLNGSEGVTGQARVGLERLDCPTFDIAIPHIVLLGFEGGRHPETQATEGHLIEHPLDAAFDEAL